MSAPCWKNVTADPGQNLSRRLLTEAALIEVGTGPTPMLLSLLLETTAYVKSCKSTKYEDKERKRKRQENDRKKFEREYEERGRQMAAEKANQEPGEANLPDLSMGAKGGARTEGKKTKLPSRPEIPEWSGIVKSINWDGFFSMIDCPEAGYERDIYVHKTVAPPGMINIGDVCAFAIHCNAKGNPQASGPFWKLQGGDISANTPTKFGEFCGRVAPEVLANGMQYVDCEEVKTVHGKNPFIAAQDVVDLRDGDEVAFDVHVNMLGSPQVSAPYWKRCRSEMKATSKGGKYKGKADAYVERMDGTVKQAEFGKGPVIPGMLPPSALSAPFGMY